MLFKLFTLFVIFHSFLLANTDTTVEVSLDSFSTVGIVLMIVLTSLLGAYFIKDEFPSSFE